MVGSDTEKHLAGSGEEAYRVKSDLSGPNDDNDNALLPDFTPADEKRIIWHIDRRLVVTIGFLYCVSLMDRTNLGAANIAGMEKDLQLGVGSRYSIITLVFFVPYVLLQPPSTVLVRKIGPRIFLAAITLLWGAVMIGMGFIKSWTVMTGLRVILGVLESGFFPGCVYLLSTWYSRYDLGKRNAAFYLVGVVASAFASVMAAGIMQMAGVAGLNGWRWIFIIEGIITCLLAVGSYWLLVDFPDSKRATWRFLTERERLWVVARVNADRGDVEVPPFRMGAYLRTGLDWKVWAYGMIFFDTTTITYALAYFLPIILEANMGFNTLQAQCLQAPLYVFAAIIMFVTGALGDRYQLRGPIVAFNVVLCLIGLPIVGFHPSPGVRYFGVFLVTAGANSNVPAVMSYMANNVRGQWKRAFASATFVGLGGVGGICGSLVFRAQDSPTYRPGIYACVATSLLSLVLVALLSINYYINNKKADRGEKELEVSEDDYQPGFRYTY
ncbi:Major facilitator superfamily domain, general substrate transporter [Niveomyces insectorum RCEF 264]|uniref:Major facilitator superfamily domain, general substrate transporter n=1 Tax=Niveomyces insectorum RCEF 264 TaxID=1081102 RepID=A0A167MN09_9HYPO|nr:Major facilitator superfamily domain, general substrate transporter [Niveomyces insectorum RCEF 264]